MPASLRREIREFVDEVAGRMHPGELFNVHAHHVVREAFDVVGVCLAAEANVEELSIEAVAAAKELAAKAPLGPIAKSFAPLVLQSAIPPLVEKLAAYAGPVQSFVDEQVLPRIDLWIETLTAVREDLAKAA